MPDVPPVELAARIAKAQRADALSGAGMPMGGAGALRLAGSVEEENIVIPEDIPRLLSHRAAPEMPVSGA